MATLRKRKKKRGYIYVIDFHYNGKRYIKSTKTSDLKVAKEIRSDIEAKISRGSFRVEETKPKADSKLSKFFDDYFKYTMSFKGANTLENERRFARTFIAVVGDRLLRTVTKKLLDDWRSQRLAKNAPTTYNIERSFLHAAFNVAMRWGFIDLNPISELRKATVEERRNYMNEEEIQRLLEAIDTDIANPAKSPVREYNVLFRKYVEFLLNTGLRRNEALGLTPEQIDLTNSVIYVEKTKSRKFRSVPLNERAREILSELDEKAFSQLRPGYVSHKFNDLMKRLKMTQFKLHSTRHTFATALVSRGVNILAIKDLLGHSSIQTSMVYSKTDPSILRESV